ncbi:MAG: hypothetical protein Q7U14_11110, partial [Lacisediminimonas sp.]|nr:hypothetical protein [Lacisediminimonas sp.]
TAISRPVTRGVFPVTNLLGAGKKSSNETLHATDLGLAIEKLAGLTVEEASTLTGTPLIYARYLLSDMLLLEGLMRGIGAAEIKVVEGALSVLPALLADDKAFRWNSRYDCYLERFGALGPDAYFSDPATCVLR